MNITGRVPLTGSLATERNDDKAARRSRAADIALRELRHFGTVFLYLAVVFGVFTLHQFVVLATTGVSYTFYGASLINALVLAKILHIAEALHFGEKFDGKPLVYPILYKSVLFGLLLVLAYIVEEIAVGLLRGESSGAGEARSRRRHAGWDRGRRGDHDRGADPVLRLKGNSPQPRRLGVRFPAVQAALV